MRNLLTQIDKVLYKKHLRVPLWYFLSSSLKNKTLSQNCPKSQTWQVLVKLCFPLKTLIKKASRTEALTWACGGRLMAVFEMHVVCKRECFCSHLWASPGVCVTDLIPAQSAQTLCRRVTSMQENAAPSAAHLHYSINVKSVLRTFG